MAKRTFKTREQWLLAAVTKLAPILSKQGDVEMPKKFAVSCGFSKSRKAASIGQCWSPTCTDDGTTHMFVCPSLKDASVVLATLLHEMIHAAVGLGCKHRGDFRKTAKTVGLEGKMTATVAGEMLKEKLEAIAKSLGAYPHSALIRNPVASRPPAGGWVKFHSTNDEDYILRLSPRALEDHGPPMDFEGDMMVES